MYLVDTNIVSEARRGTLQAVSWLRSVDPLTIHLSALTLGEIMPPSTRSTVSSWLAPQSFFIATSRSSVW